LYHAAECVLEFVGARPPRQSGGPVIESLRRILSNPSSPVIACSDVAVSIFGESALVICREGVEGQPAVLVATNVFVREDSAWRMVHHQAGPTAPAAPPPAPNRSLN